LFFCFYSNLCVWNWEGYLVVEVLSLFEIENQSWVMQECVTMIKRATTCNIATLKQDQIMYVRGQLGHEDIPFYRW